MTQADAISLNSSVGYALKETANALRTAMEDALTPLGMSVTYYSCLELLGQRPGMSNTELAKGAFVTRQAMSVLLRTLERDGLVTRPTHATVGRRQPAELTQAGKERLTAASTAVKVVETTMLDEASKQEQAELLALLRRMTASLKQ